MLEGSVFLSKGEGGSRLAVRARSVKGDGWECTLKCHNEKNMSLCVFYPC